MAMPVPSGHIPQGGMMHPQAVGGMNTNHFGQHHVYPYPTTFMFQDKTIYTGNLRKGTTVCNPDGTLAFNTKDAVLTLHNKEVVYDALHRPIASLHKKTISMHGTWQIFRGDSTSSSDLIAEIQPALMNVGGKTIKLILAGQKEPAFVVKGNFLGRAFSFIDGNNQVIAECKRHGKFHSAMNYLSGEDTFTLTVQPGLDTALLVCVTLVIDDILAGGKE